MTIAPVAAAEKIICKMVELDRFPIRAVGFGVHDSKGREIGSRVFSKRVRFETQDTDKSWGYRVAPERMNRDLWIWEPQGARDGAKFGALQADHICESAEAMETEIAKYLAGARRRAPKIAAK